MRKFNFYMKKTIKVHCALCGRELDIDPASIPENGTDINFFCLLCGTQVADLIEEHNLPGHIELHHPQR